MRRTIWNRFLNPLSLTALTPTGWGSFCLGAARADAEKRGKTLTRSRDGIRIGIRFEKERDFSEGCATPVYAEKAGDRTVVVSGTNRVDFRLALKMDSDRNPWSMTGGQISGVAFLLRSQVASCD